MFRGGAAKLMQHGLAPAGGQRERRRGKKETDFRKDRHVIQFLLAAAAVVCLVFIFLFMFLS